MLKIILGDIIVKKLYGIFEYLSKNNFTQRSSNIAFFLILDGIPLFALVFLVLSQLNVYYEPDISDNLIPKEISEVFNIILTSDSSIKGFSIFIFSLSATYSTSTLFLQLKGIGSELYDDIVYERNLTLRIVSIITSVVFILFIITLLIVSLLSRSVLGGLFGNNFNWLLSNLASYTLLYLLVVFINIVVPPIKINVFKLQAGVLLSLMYILVGSYAFSIYVSNYSNYSDLYGKASLIILFILWFYIIAQGLYVGILLNKWMNTRK